MCRFIFLLKNVIILFCNFALIVIIFIINVFTVTFDKFNASLLNKSINFFQKKIILTEMYIELEKKLKMHLAKCIM